MKDQLVQVTSMPFTLTKTQQYIAVVSVSTISFVNVKPGKNKSLPLFLHPDYLSLMLWMVV